MPKETTEEEVYKLLDSTKSSSIYINGKSYWLGPKNKKKIKDYLNQEHTGGVLPLLGLIPAIIAGLTTVGKVAAVATPIIAGTAAAASAIANTVKKSKEAAAAELSRQKQEIELNKAKEVKAETKVETIEKN